MKETIQEPIQWRVVCKHISPDYDEIDLQVYLHQTIMNEEGKTKKLRKSCGKQMSCSGLCNTLFGLGQSD